MLAQLRHHVPAKNPAPPVTVTRWWFQVSTLSGQALRSMHALRLKIATHLDRLFCHELHEFSLIVFSLPRITRIFTKAFFVSIREIRGESSVLPRITQVFTKVFFFRVNSWNSWPIDVTEQGGFQSLTRFSSFSYQRQHPATPTSAIPPD